MKTKVAIKFLKGVEKHRSGFSRLASNGFVESKSQPFPTSYTWLAAQLTLLLLLKLLFDVHFITFRWPMTNSNHWQRWSGHDIPKFELWLGKHNKKKQPTNAEYEQVQPIKNYNLLWLSFSFNKMSWEVTSWF